MVEREKWNNHPPLSCVYVSLGKDVVNQVNEHQVNNTSNCQRTRGEEVARLKKRSQKKTHVNVFSRIYFDTASAIVHFSAYHIPSIYIQYTVQIYLFSIIYVCTCYIHTVCTRLLAVVAEEESRPRFP